MQPIGIPRVLSYAGFETPSSSAHAACLRNARRKDACLEPLGKWLWVKSRHPKWNPGKWKHGPKPAVPWWFISDSYPNAGVIKKPAFREERQLAEALLHEGASGPNQSPSTQAFALTSGKNPGKTTPRICLCLVLASHFLLCPVACVISFWRPGPGPRWGVRRVGVRGRRRVAKAKVMLGLTGQAGPARCAWPPFWPHQLTVPKPANHATQFAQRTIRSSDHGPQRCRFCGL